MTKIFLTLVVFTMALQTTICIKYIPSNGCPYNALPGTPYFVQYPDGFTTGGTVGSSGSFTLSKRGFNCGQIIVLFGTSFGFQLSASPASVYLPAPPTTGTVTGQGFDATYGMPTVDYFDSNGYLIGTAYASSVASGGASLQANMPDLSYVYSGTYQVKVTNKRYDGYYLNTVGTATMTGYGRDRVDSDGDGWYDDEDCDPYDPGVHVMCGECGGGDPGPPYQLPGICEY